MELTRKNFRGRIIINIKDNDYYFLFERRNYEIR